MIVGAYRYDNGSTDEGAAFVYYGSPSGLSAAPDWTVEGDQPGAQLGQWVGCTGTVPGGSLACSPLSKRSGKIW